MKFSLPYGRGEVKVRLSDSIGITEPPPLVFPPVRDMDTLLRRAVDAPLGCDPLGSKLRGADRVSLLISDITRGGSGELLSALLSILAGYGLNGERLAIVLATGMHRHLDEGELEEQLGDILRYYSILQHDPRDEQSCVQIGESPRGTPYSFMKYVVDSDLIIVLGAVSFHYFAGFGGGRKLLLPGVAGEETIVSNHRLSLKEDPALGLNYGCRPGNLRNNPVHEDMLRGIEPIRNKVFSINYFMNDDGDVVFVNAGEVVMSHEQACRRYREMFAFPLDRRYRCALISAGGYPTDINLLQAHKAIRHISYAMEEGGVVFVAAECPEGVGSESYLEAFADGPEGVERNVRKRYTLNAQTAVSTKEMLDKFSIYMLGGLGNEVLEKFGFSRWIIEETDDIISTRGIKDVLVVKKASRYLPVYGSSDGDMEGGRI